MNKPGCHRTGLDAHFGVDTSVLRNTSRNWPGIGGADAAPEPLALRVDNADRGRLLRYVQPNIMRHRNLRWCKSPGNMPGSRHYRCLRLRTAITRGPHHQGAATRISNNPRGFFRGEIATATRIVLPPVDLPAARQSSDARPSRPATAADSRRREFLSPRHGPRRDRRVRAL